MLVLTRKGNQSIMIGDDIEVSVLSIMGEKVRIGISAPRDVPVFRKEVYLEIQAEQAQELAATLTAAAAREGAVAGELPEERSPREERDEALRKLTASGD